MHILYAEDEQQLSMAVAEVLRMEGYTVEVAADGAQALSCLQQHYYDAVILDIMMPQMSGIEVLQEMRAHQNYTPVLMLTAKTTTDDRVDGLSEGADDYLGKPFAMRELIARLNAIIRRSSVYKDHLLAAANLTLDCESGEMRTDCGSLRLSARECELLALFLRHPDAAFTTQQIIQAAWHGQTDESSVTLYVSYLKNKLRQIHACLQIICTQDTYRIGEVSGP